MDAKTMFETVKKHNPSVLGHEQFRKFAVLLPIIEKNNELHVVFEVRSHQLKGQTLGTIIGVIKEEYEGLN